MEQRFLVGSEEGRAENSGAGGETCDNAQLHGTILSLSCGEAKLLIVLRPVHGIVQGTKDFGIFAFVRHLPPLVRSCPIRKL
jgi:hypothetical protein